MKNHPLPLALAALLLALCAPALRAQSTAVAASTAYEASRVVSDAPALLMSLHGYNSKGSAQFIQVHDSATVPSEAVTGVAEVSTADTTGATPAGLADTYFLLSGAAGGYYVWFNLDAGGTDPAVSGRTGIEVAIATGDSESQLATKLATAIDGEDDFGASPSTNVVTITDAATGARTDIADGDSGLTLAVDTQGVTAIAAAVPLLVITVPAASNFSVQLPATGLWCRSGISVCNSSTGPTKTIGSADVFFTATFR